MDKERSELLRRIQLDYEDMDSLNKYESMMSRLGYAKIYIESYISKEITGLYYTVNYPEGVIKNKYTTLNTLWIPDKIESLFATIKELDLYIHDQENRIFKVKRPKYTYTGSENNLAGINTVNPSNQDDSANGFNIGTLWMNVMTSQTWACVDSTVGNAIWTLISETNEGEVSS